MTCHFKSYNDPEHLCWRQYTIPRHGALWSHIAKPTHSIANVGRLKARQALPRQLGQSGMSPEWASQPVKQLQHQPIKENLGLDAPCLRVSACC